MESVWSIQTNPSKTTGQRQNKVPRKPKRQHPPRRGPANSWCNTHKWPRGTDSRQITYSEQFWRSSGAFKVVTGRSNRYNRECNRWQGCNQHCQQVNEQVLGGRAALPDPRYSYSYTFVLLMDWTSHTQVPVIAIMLLLKYIFGNVKFHSTFNVYKNIS